MSSIASMLYGDDERALRELTARAPELLARSRAAALRVVVPPLELALAVSGLLTMPVGNVALLAWHQELRVRRARKETSLHPGSRQVVRLLDHTISSKQQPSLDVESGPVRGTLLVLTLQVDIAINATNLIIEDGKIVEARPGAASATASLMAGDLLLARRQVAGIDLGLEQARFAA